MEPAKANVNGKSYLAELGTVKEAWLGREDHGIFTYMLTINFGGKEQGAGAYNLNNAERMGLHLQALLNFFGCPWNYIQNKRVYALQEHAGGTIVGLLNESKSKSII